MKRREPESEAPAEAAEPAPASAEGAVASAAPSEGALQPSPDTVDAPPTTAVAGADGAADEPPTKLQKRSLEDTTSSAAADVRAASESVDTTAEQQEAVATAVPSAAGVGATEGDAAPTVSAGDDAPMADASAIPPASSGASGEAQATADGAHQISEAVAEPAQLPEAQTPQQQQSLTDKQQQEQPLPEQQQQQQQAQSLPEQQQQQQQQQQPPQGQAEGAEQEAEETEDKSVKFENALDFLDQVKVQFADRPKVYTQFLEIMKDFKAQLVDTPGVIARVQDLFQGHKPLILGFNTFLPTGYTMEYGDGGSGLSVTTPQGVVHNIPLSRPGALTGGVSAATEKEEGAPAAAPAFGGQVPAAVPTPGIQGVAAVQGASARKQPEFDHARNYVKKIKVRFAGQPQVYKAFLEILHTYHKEQHTIKDVYEQVAQLFHSHTDLLDEFQQFLPDPVAQGQQQQASAASAVAMAAREKHSRKSNGSRGKRTEGKGGRRSKSAQAQTQQAVANDVANRAELQAQLSAQSAHVVALQLGATAAGSGADYLAPLPAPEPLATVAAAAAATRTIPRGKYEELNFFYRVKQRLTPKVYFEFLKCLNLFSRNIISRMELVLLVRDLLGHHRDLFSWFKQFIGFDDASMAVLDKHDDRVRERSGEPPSIRAEDVDLDRCRRHGPSYRALPRSVIPDQCSGQTDPLYASVLNEKWNSTASGSEDFGFKNLRKNPHEEILFKCEDDRFELDLIIEQQASCQKALQYILKQISDLPTAAERVRFRLDRSLDILHVRVIERLYGDSAGKVLQELYRAPAAVIPVLIERMREKNSEWSHARKAWNVVWREVTEHNHLKSLDHQSFYFKQTDKKTMAPSSILTQMRGIHHEDLRRRAKEGAPLEGSHHVFENMGDVAVLEDTLNVVRAAIARYISKDEQGRVSTLIRHFIRPFFGLSKEVSDEAAAQVDSGIPAPFGLFFGDEDFYVFFWLFQLLYSRLAKAKAMAIPVSAPETARQDKDKYLDILNPEAAKLRETTKSGKSDAYKAFLSNVLLPHVGPERLAGSRNTNLAVPGVAVANARDASNAYEEASRHLFGSGAHFLFTLEKLCHYIVQQLQGLVSGDNHSRLLVLYSVEARRHASEPQAADESTETLYYSNCIDVLASSVLAEDRERNDSGSSTNSDKANEPPQARCVRFEYKRAHDPNAVPSLVVTLLDSKMDPPKFVDFSAAQHTRWAQYVEAFVKDTEQGPDRSMRATWETAQKNRVFLLRTARRLSEPRADAGSDEAKGLEGVVASTGLEARVAINTNQLHYVENTGDYLMREEAVAKLKSQSPSGHDRRGSRLDSIATRISQDGPAPEGGDTEMNDATQG